MTIATEKVMSIQIQVEQLILEDLELSPSQRSHLQTMVETELIHLIETRGLPPDLQGTLFIPKLPGAVNVLGSTNAEQLGKEIAQLIYAKLNS